MLNHWGMKWQREMEFLKIPSARALESQSAFTFSKLTIKTLEESMKYVQS